MARTSNRRFTTCWLTIFSTAAALGASTRTRQPGLSRSHHSGQCECTTEHSNPFHLHITPSQGNRSVNHPDCQISVHLTSANRYRIPRPAAGNKSHLISTSLLLRVPDIWTGVTVADFAHVSFGSHDLRDLGIPLQSEGCMTYRREKILVLSFWR